MRNHGREKKNTKKKREESSRPSGIPEKFPFHLIELCSKDTQTKLKKACESSSYSIQYDTKDREGNRLSEKFVDGFPKILVRNEVNREDQFGNTPLLYLAGGEKRGGGYSPKSVDFPLHQLGEYYSERAPSYLLLNLLSNWKADPNIVDPRGSSPLHHAVLSNRSDVVVEALLKFGANPNLRDHEGVAPLHLDLISWSHFFLLLENGADPNLTNKRNETPLHILLKKPMKWDRKESKLSDVGSIDTALLLLQHPSCDPNAQNENGETPLHILFKSRRVKKAAVIVREILKRGGDPTIKDNQGRTPYQYALDRFCNDGYSLFYIDEWMKNHAPEKLLQARRSVGWPHDLFDHDRNTILHLLMEEILVDRKPRIYPGLPRYVFSSIREEILPFHENLERIQEILVKKPNVNAKNSRGETPLHIAARSSFYEGVKILVCKNGAAMNSHNSNLETPLFYAVASLKDLDEECSREIARLEKELSERKTFLRDHNVRENELAALEPIRKQGGEEEGENKSEEKEWDGNYLKDELLKRFTIQKENGMRIIEFLLSEGADPNVETREKKTALYIASTLPDPIYCSRTVQLLLKAGANPNLKDSRGRTPMMIICDNVKSDAPEEIFHLLIEGGTDLEAVDNEGLDCLFRLVGSPHAPVSIIQQILKMDFVFDPEHLPNDKSVLHEAIDCLPKKSDPISETTHWEKQAMIIEMMVAKGVCARTRLKKSGLTALEYFVDVTAKYFRHYARRRKPFRGTLGPIFLRIGIALGAGGVTQLEKDFLENYFRNSADECSALVSCLWEQLDIYHDMKPAKKC